MIQNSKGFNSQPRAAVLIKDGDASGSIQCSSIRKEDYLPGNE